MTARILDGRPVAEAIWAEIEREAAILARPATLALVSSDDPASAAYGAQIERQFSKRGLAVSSHPPPTSEAELRELLAALGDDETVDGVLVMTPLSAGISSVALSEAIPADKDVDGMHPRNLGRLVQRRPRFAPATALGGMKILEHYAVPVRGRRAVVIGRSTVVGLPLALLLLVADATVSVCHSRTVDLAAVTREADILCVAAGRPELVGPELVRPGATVLDFGTHPTDGGMLGDVQFESVAQVAGAITPVRGGTGTVTTAVLALQTLSAARRFSRDPH